MDLTTLIDRIDEKLLPLVDFMYAAAEKLARLQEDAETESDVLQIHTRVLGMQVSAIRQLSQLRKQLMAPPDAAPAAPEPGSASASPAHPAPQRSAPSASPTQNSEPKTQNSSSPVSAFPPPQNSTPTRPLSSPPTHNSELKTQNSSSPTPTPQPPSPNPLHTVSGALPQCDPIVHKLTPTPSSLNPSRPPVGGHL